VGQDQRRSAQAAGIEPEVVDIREPGLERDWLALAERCEGSSYFQTPDWVISWWETIADRPATRVATWRGESGELEALVALSRGRERLHRRLPVSVGVYANAGSGPGDADHCAWLVTDAQREAVARWVGKAIGRSPLLVRAAPPAWDTGALPPTARQLDATTCPRLALPALPGSAGPSKDFVRQLRRFTRRLEGKGVRIDWVAPDRLDQGLLDGLFALKPEFFDARQRAFQGALAGRAEADRGPAAVVARHDSRVVGVLYGFWWGDTFAAYQHGWDRDYARDALGNVLVLHALELAAEHGARWFEFMRGREPYKYRFGASDAFDRTWLVSSGPTGALLRVGRRLRRGHRAVPPQSSG
jgi:CelD/BcsL family acetyltransferase involved in cellulose biosynthesis